MRKRSILLVMSALLLAGIDISSGADEVDLKLRLQEGQSFKLMLSADTTIRQTMQGEQLDVRDVVSMGHVFDVQKIEPDGAALVKVTYQSFNLKESGPAGVIEYDSAKTREVPPLASGFAALVGQSYTIKITPEGRIRDIQGADAALKRGIASLGALPEPWKSSMQKLLADRLDSQALREGMESLFGFYPAKPVDIGERWSRTIIAFKGFPASIAEYFWKIVERKDGVLAIKFYSTVKPNPDAPPAQLGLYNVKPSMSGKQEGVLEVDEKTGMIVRGKASGRLSGKMQIVGGQELSVPVTIEGTSTIAPF